MLDLQNCLTIYLSPKIPGDQANETHSFQHLTPFQRFNMDMQKWQLNARGYKLKSHNYVIWATNPSWGHEKKQIII